MRYIIAFLISLSFCMAKADAVGDARKFADARNYNAAISLLNEEISRGGASSGLYYDLGVVYNKSGNLGASALNFAKALRLDPSNKEAKNNSLVVAADVQRLNESLTGDKNLDPTPQISGAGEKISGALAACGSNFWCVLAIVTFIIGISAIGVYFLSAGVTVRKIGFFGGIAVILLSCVLFIFALVARNSQLATDRAVIMSAQVQLKSAPGENGKDIAAPLAGGTLVKVVSTRQMDDKTQWAEVFLNTDYNGWIPASDLEIINIPGMK